jgi:hypothetical protein
MRKFLMVLLPAAAAMASLPAQARDTPYALNIAQALQSPEFQEKLGNSVAFYFAAQPTPPVAQPLGTFVSNKKANSFGRPDEDACRRALLDALITFKDRALELGGNAVVNLVSYYKKETVASPTDYQCHAGDLMAGVALKGDVVKLGR